MTIIYTATEDQHLIGTLIPTLAADNVNTVRLHVAFDNSWASFPARSAVFTTDRSARPYPVDLSSSGDCLVPPEVLVGGGKLFIVVKGTNSTSGGTKSTTRLTLKVQGGHPALLISDPSPSVYQQLSTAQAVLSSRMSGMEAAFSTMPVGLDGDWQAGVLEVVGLRTGANGNTYQTAGDAVRAQVGAVMQSNGGANPLQPLLFTQFVYYRGSDELQTGDELTTPVYNIGDLGGYATYTNAGKSVTNLIGAKFYSPVPVFRSFTGEYVLLVKIDRDVKNVGLYFGNSPNWNRERNTYINKSVSLTAGYNLITLEGDAVFNDVGHSEYNYFYINFAEDLIDAGVTDLEVYLIRSDSFIGCVNQAVKAAKEHALYAEKARSSVYADNVGCIKPSIASYMSDVLRYEDEGAYRLEDNPSEYRLIVSDEHHIAGSENKWFQGFCLGLGKKAVAVEKTLYINVKSNNAGCTIQNLSKLALHNTTSNWNGVNISQGITKVSDIDLSAYDDDDEIYLIFGILAGTASAPKWNVSTCDLSVTVLEKTESVLWSNIEANNYITCWGDSLTSLGGWTTKLRELSGMTVYNAGTGGENVRTITARQGADAIMVNGITIPAAVEPVTLATYASPLKTAFGYNATPLLQGGAHVNPVKLGNVEGTLKWTGSSYSDTSGTWTFTRSVAGDEVVIDRPTALTTAYDREKNSPYLMVIFMGQNGGYNSDNEELVNLHRLMIDHAKAKHVIVLGLSSGSTSSSADYEAAMKKAFGRYFISLREYLSQYGLADAGLTPTTADTIAMMGGTVPPQLLADDVHYTDATKIVIGNLIYKRCCELGIFEA